MPWRRTKDPYRILLAEYMLQRTRIVSGTRYYERFLERFPDVATLASASEEDVLRAWEGLGYYRRARNLQAAAKAIVRDHGGRIPSDAATLASLPGIGPYTAGAVASIAFGEAVPAVDGNATRVLARLFRVDVDVGTAAGRTRIQELAQALVPTERPGAFNQALMELGSTVCMPRHPDCRACPLRAVCLARAAGVESSLPRISPARVAPTVPVAFAYVRSRERVLLVRRPEAELLGGLWSLPGGEVSGHRAARAGLGAAVAAQTGLRVDVGESVAPVDLVFSHRRWSGSVFRCTPRGRGPLTSAARWVTDEDVRRLPLVPDHRRLVDQLRSLRSLDSFDASRRSRT